MPAENHKFRLISITGENISKSTPANVDVEICVDMLKVRYGVVVTIDRPESQVRVEVCLTYLQGGDTVFSGRVSSIFEVQSLDSLISEKDDGREFRVEQNFLPMLVNVAFGTARGYFAARNIGTSLENYPFPVMDMDNVMKHVEYLLI